MASLDDDGPYVEFRIHEKHVDPATKVVGSWLGESIGSNWFGSFSSGKAGFVRYWHFRDKEYIPLLALFQTAENNRWVYKYPQLQLDRANGNCGSHSIVFDASNENIALVCQILRDNGYRIVIREDM